MITRRTQKGNIKITLSVEDARNLNVVLWHAHGTNDLNLTKDLTALVGQPSYEEHNDFLKPILEGALLDASNSLVHAIYASTKPGTKAFWPDQAYHLARRAHRYARILEVMS